MTAIDLSKQEALEVDPKAIHQINFSGNSTKIQQCFPLFKNQKKLF